MKTLFKRVGAALLFNVALAFSIHAAPEKYVFDYAASDIGFTYEFNGDTVQGKFPNFTGDLVVDFTNVSNSKVTVDIDASKGKGGFVFATNALRGPKVLDTDTYPSIKFVSTNAQMSNGRATVNGNVTVKDITKPMSLQVRFFQFQGQDPSNLDELKMTITGSLNRRDFGANGYPDLVGDLLNITIDAKINKK